MYMTHGWVYVRLLRKEFQAQEFSFSGRKREKDMEHPGGATPNILDLVKSP